VVDVGPGARNGPVMQHQADVAHGPTQGRTQPLFVAPPPALKLSPGRRPGTPPRSIWSV
jgi:hypothetical protein